MTDFPRDSLRDIALGYAVRGVHIFPLLPNTKEPATDHGFYAATTDPKMVAWWWGELPEANIGLPTGALNGIFAIDLDPYKDVSYAGATLNDALAWASGQGIDLAPTAIIETPRGGFHCFYRVPENTTVRNRKLTPYIDVRGDGGYVVAAGSRINGRSYVAL